MGMSPVARGKSRGNKYNAITEINITPFVDVMLVLLVVFMITAPMLTQGVQVSLPQVENTEVKTKDEPIQVTVKKGGSIYVGVSEVDSKTLPKKLEAIKKVRVNPQIILLADKDVDYGSVMQVMSALQNAGLVDVSMLTEPLGSK